MRVSLLYQHVRTRQWLRGQAIDLLHIRRTRNDVHGFISFGVEPGLSAAPRLCSVIVNIQSDVLLSMLSRPHDCLNLQQRFKTFENPQGQPKPFFNYYFHLTPAAVIFFQPLYNADHWSFNTASARFLSVCIRYWISDLSSLYELMGKVGVSTGS